jgi:hypothetical protein
MSSRNAAIAAVLIVSIISSPVSTFAQESTGAAPLVTLEAISVEPTAPGADTLCKLQVTLQNKGTEVASQLDFKVKINGQELPVYRNQLFMYPVQPDQSAQIQLYNFWSTETSRPMPADGKLTVEVSLVAAQWMKIAMEDEVEVWEPLGPVDGLPSSQSVTLTMQR